MENYQELQSSSELFLGREDTEGTSVTLTFAPALYQRAELPLLKHVTHKQNSHSTLPGALFTMHRLMSPKANSKLKE